jgi:hypothetical protein
MRPYYETDKLHIPISGSPDALPVIRALRDWQRGVQSPSEEAETELFNLATVGTPEIPQLIIRAPETIELLGTVLRDYEASTTTMVLEAYRLSGGHATTNLARDLGADPELYREWILAQRAADLGQEILTLIPASDENV